MKNYKIRYQFIYNGELVVQGNSYNDAAKLGQEYFNGENAYDNIKSEMPNGFADLKFKVQSITPTKQRQIYGLNLKKLISLIALE